MGTECLVKGLWYLAIVACVVIVFSAARRGGIVIDVVATAEVEKARMHNTRSFSK
jgi:hypothetical protein